MCIYEKEREEGKEEERKVIASRSAIFLHGSQPSDVKVKISNVNSRHKVNEHVDNEMDIGSMLRLYNRKCS